MVVDIAAPPSRVWPVIRDVERWHEWTASVTRITRLDEGPLRPGSRAQVEQPRLPKNTFVVTALEEDRGFTWETSSPGLRGAGHHWIEPIDGGRGSRVTLGVDFRGPLAWVRTEGADELRGRMERLVVEHGSRFAPDPGWSSL